MPRNARVKSQSGYYHIMLRGNERRNIFNDDDDKLRFLETLNEKKQDNRFNLQAFCLMDNHVHLMLSQRTEDIASVMKRITVSYVFYYNKKYNRVGHLFQDRYRSEVVEQDSYVLALVRYIHQNPVKAGMVKSPSDYKWSSYNCYSDKGSTVEKMIDTDLILGLFSSDRANAIELFKKYMNNEGEEKFIEMEENMVTDEDAKQLFENLLNQYNIKKDSEIKAQLPDELINEFRKRTGFSIRKIAVITNQNKDRVNRAINS